MRKPGQNAEASSSKSPKLPSLRGGKRADDVAARAKSPTGSSNHQKERTMSPAPSGTGSRRVRTVPPHAVFEPPTPPLSPALITNTDQPQASTSTTTGKRPRMRLRYSTSESSGNETDESDEEPPWWTFTQRGMMKMRERRMRGRSDLEMGTGPSEMDSGREDRRPSSRRSSTGGMKRKSNPDLKGSLATKLLHPAPIRSASSKLLARRSKGAPNLTLPQSIEMFRSNSAPSSPVGDAPSPGMTTLVESIRLSDESQMQAVMPPISTRSPPKAPRRQLTAPALPRFLRRPEEAVTDSEVSVPRMRRTGTTFVGVATDGESTPEGGSTPSRPRERRRPTARLRMQSHVVRDHFRDGWPQVGSWQDALHGHYDETGAADKRRSSADSRRGSLPKRTTKMMPDGDEAGRTQSWSSHNPTKPDPTTPTGTPGARRKAKRDRPRRNKRYRQAMVPPTPSGLGFTPSGLGPDDAAWKEGRVGGYGFDWGNIQRRPEGEGDIPEDDELARSDTRATAVQDKEGLGNKAMFWRRKPPGVKKQAMQREIEDWKKRWRRTLFLDARVTIYTRVFNLLIAIASLGLGIAIRHGLRQLSLPGLIGSSTTLIIAYASFTILHILTAIYREYFGKPIGLWALRSKMLWVCLDLLFVALWASALSLAVNDYIGTPLECSPLDPWWRQDLSDEYARLVSAMDLEAVKGFSHTLAIHLPDAVVSSPLAHAVCQRQVGSIALSLLTLLLYGGNMVVSLFRIFETVRRTANVHKTVMV